MKILGIESSCDETGAAIVEDGKKILTNVVASSADMHVKYGGIVPEVAARKQVESMIPVLTEALNRYTKDHIDAIAVTVGPGLIGSLLVGVETAKTLAFSWNKPLIPVNHVLAHIYAAFLHDSTVIPAQAGIRIPGQARDDKKISFPAIALVVSGGHTELYLMTNEHTLKWLGGTLDDAAGEAFDKTARLLGLPYPGGPQIAAAADKFIVNSSQLTVKLPRPMMYDKTLYFSFSGLKTAIQREWKKHSSSSQWADRSSELVNMFAYEVQEAITDVLVSKTLFAAEKNQVKSIIVTGGVAANKRLTEKFLVHSSKFQVAVPKAQLCVDSATFIASYAFYNNAPLPWKNITAQPNLSVEV